MTSLITDDIITACAKGQGCDEPESCDCREWIRDGLIAVLPAILHEVLERIHVDAFQDHGEGCGVLQEIDATFHDMLIEIAQMSPSGDKDSV